MNETFAQPRKSNSQVAKDGNKAEFDFCHNQKIKESLSQYFGKGIAQVKKITGQKKSDILVLCTDGTQYTLQLKSGTGGGRGWSCDRRSLSNLPVDTVGQQLVGNLCLKKGTDRPVVSQPVNLIVDLLLGTELEYKPTHFVHIAVNKVTGDLQELSICDTTTVLHALQQEAYPSLEPKKTCVHLSPRMYLQRKGGGSKDHAPDDIQLKLKSFPHEIMTNLYMTEPDVEML
jgi:hypothetical protein